MSEFAGPRRLWGLAGDFWARDPGRSCLALTLTATTGLLNGVGLLVLLPLLAATGLLESSAEQPAAWVGDLFRAVEPETRLPLVLVVYVVIVGFYAVLKYVAARVNARLVMDYVDQTRTEIYHRVLASPWRVINRQYSHEITNQLSSNLDWLQRGVYGICQIAGALLVAAFQLLVACILSLELLLLALVLIVCGYPVMRWLQQRAMGSGLEAVTQHQRMHEASGSLITRFKQIKAHGREHKEQQDLATSSRSLADIGIDLQVSAARMQLIFELLAVGLIAGLFYVGFTWLQVPVANLLVFLFVISQLLPRLVQMQRMLQTLVQAVPAHESYQRFVAGLEQAGSTRQETPVKHAGHYERFSYRFLDDTEGPVGFNGLCLEFRVGEITALVGESGIGKTSLCDVLAGLHPECCDVEVDGQPLHPADWASLRGNLAYMPQSAQPWQKTVREVLQWGRGEVEEGTAWEMLERVGLQRRIARQDKGLDAPLGDTGIGLSGGELQRLMLAQALLIKPRLLILDEITSALDSETERQIISALSKARSEMAIVVATHRSDLSGSADHCYELHRQDDRVVSLCKCR